jgi:hypothetical protein
MKRDRYEEARRYFREHHSGIEPDEQFAQRVVARLPRQSDAALGWAVARVLPATLALLLALMWASWQVTPAPAVVQEPSPTEDVLSWALGSGGETP